MQKIKPPIMGWSSWNYFRQSINEEKILGIAKAMKDSGLSDVGYQYINLDDCWHSSKRNRQGELQFDLTNFPRGEKLVSDIHQMGLKVGLYSSSGSMTCEDLPGSYEHERIDAETFHRWQIDFLKYDYCHVVDLKSDEKWLIHAPDLVSIEFYHKATKERFLLLSEAGQLTGDAQLNREEISFITGLGNNQGSVSWKKRITPGDYVITIEYKKKVTEQRLLLVLKLGTQEVVIHFPTSSGWSLTGREQCEFFLEEEINQVVASNPIHDQKSDAILRYQTMFRALESIYKESPFQFSICEHGRSEPWTWAQGFSNQYRIDHDIRNTWESVLSCYEKAVEVSKYAVEGSYGDPDMLEVGNNALSKIENESHFSLWSFLAAPLILGNDLRDFVKEGVRDNHISNHALEILTNQAVIEFNQSSPYLPAIHLNQGPIDLLMKTLDNGKSGLLVFNKSEEVQKVEIDLRDLPTVIHGNPFNYKNRVVKEAWRKSFQQRADTIILDTIEAHEVYVFIFEE